MKEPRVPFSLLTLCYIFVTNVHCVMIRFRYQRYVTFSLPALCYVFVAYVMIRFRDDLFVTFSPNVFITSFIPDYFDFRSRQNLLIVESPPMNPSRHHLWLMTLKKTGSSQNNGALVLESHHKLLLRCLST